MLVRYTKDNKGRAVRQAVIYTEAEHSITNDDIDDDAIRIVRRLQANGHTAYVVGGAVRDLLIGKHPKDFDIATDAQPNRIRRLFRNSRVIGRRFRLAHIFFEDNKIIEVSTYRSETSVGFQNEYGDIEEDAFRRDFTMNALFYCPLTRRIIDYVGGVKDIRDRKLKPLIPVDRIFVEDPVRMIRAVKYRNSTGFRMVGRLRRALRKSRDLLEETPYSRMTEEIFKILLSGFSESIFRECQEYAIFRHMLPAFAERVTRDREYAARFYARLGDLDREVREGNEDRRSRGIAYLCADYLYEYSKVGKEPRISFTDAFAELKELIRPVVPANKDIELALVYLIRRRKNYLKGGKLEITPPSDRPRQEDEPLHASRDGDGTADSGGRRRADAVGEAGDGDVEKKKRRRRRRPRSRTRRDDAPRDGASRDEAPRDGASRDDAPSRGGAAAKSV